tara:strand:- start:276 stop:914 length:639 start_codon:yes stop_codon:yes gene_type:complete
MRTFFLTKFLFLLSLLLQAQNSEAAKNLLDEVSKTIEGFNNLSFNFTYVLENRQENIRQQTEGFATISGDLYKVNFLGNEQLFDGEKTYTVIPENEEITVSKSGDDNEFGINPSELLVFYKQGYAFQWDIKQNVAGRPIQFIKLIPNKESNDLKYLLLGIDLRKKTIYRLIEVTTTDTRTTLTLKDLKTNLSLSPNFFSFDFSKYPDYYINN